jgi:hypothetical protein
MDVRGGHRSRPLVFAWGALVAGLRVAFSLPAAMLFAAGLGFGALGATPAAMATPSRGEARQDVSRALQTL